MVVVQVNWVTANLFPTLRQIRGWRAVKVTVAEGKVAWPNYASAGFTGYLNVD